MRLSVTIQDTVSPRLRRAMNTLQGSDRAGLNRAMGMGIQVLTENHLRMLAGSRHDTANRLGAAPSNFLAQAAEMVASPSALTSTTNGATLTINHPGMVRALRDVTIVPREAKSLAIPVDALAYNRRPAQLWESLHLFIPKGKNVIAMSAGKNQIRVLYVLVRSVTQRQDRTLLPSDEEIRRAAHEEADAYVTAVALGRQSGGRLV